MSSPYYRFTVNRPQNEPSGDQIHRNNAGGYVYEISDLERARRFLILGSENSYYTTGDTLTKDNAKTIISLVKRNDPKLLSSIQNVSLGGLAPRQEPVLFAYAIACSLGSEFYRADALRMLNDICRTSTHLFTFIEFVEKFRGWGPQLRKAVSNWYLSMDPDKLAYQAIKYRQRNGWTHRDVIRLAHPKATEQETSEIINWIVNRKRGAYSSNSLIESFELAQALSPDQGVPAPEVMYRQISELPWEAYPTKLHGDPRLWMSLLDTDSLPLGAIVRQLPRLTSLGILDDLRYLEKVWSKLHSASDVTKARLHPLNLIVATRNYVTGSNRSFTWSPVPNIVSALEAAIENSFYGFYTSPKKVMVALDVSGSMTFNKCAGVDLTPREASAAMAAIFAKRYPNASFYAFTSELSKLNITKSSTYYDILRTVERLPFGATDCSLPMLYAIRNKIYVDAFVVYTDNETWAGDIKPSDALQEYRKQVNPDAKLIVQAMTGTEFSIANPDDPGMLDIAGADSSSTLITTRFINNQLQL